MDITQSYGKILELAGKKVWFSLSDLSFFSLVFFLIFLLFS